MGIQPKGFLVVFDRLIVLALAGQSSALDSLGDGLWLRRLYLRGHQRQTKEPYESLHHSSLPILYEARTRVNDSQRQRIPLAYLLT